MRLHLSVPYPGRSRSSPWTSPPAALRSGGTNLSVHDAFVPLKFTPFCKCNSFFLCGWNPIAIHCALPSRLAMPHGIQPPDTPSDYEIRALACLRTGPRRAWRVAVRQRDKDPIEKDLEDGISLNSCGMD